MDNARKPYVEKFKKIGNNVLSVIIYATDKDGNYCPLNEDWDNTIIS